MTSERIREIQAQTAYPQSISVMLALKQVWNECEQDSTKYSEEEVLALVQKALTHRDDGEIGSLVTAQGKIRKANLLSWFEQFKKLLILLLFGFFISCSAEQKNKDVISSSFIPERFVGNWLSVNSLSAEIKINKITVETNKELITRTKGTTIEDNNTTLFRTDLGNKEELILLFRERDENTKDDDMIGITLYRDGKTITNTYYLRNEK